MPAGIKRPYSRVLRGALIREGGSGKTFRRDQPLGNQGGQLNDALTQRWNVLNQGIAPRSAFMLKARRDAKGLERVTKCGGNGAGAGNAGAARGNAGAPSADRSDSECRQRRKNLLSLMTARRAESSHYGGIQRRWLNRIPSTFRERHRKGIGCDAPV